MLNVPAVAVGPDGVVLPTVGMVAGAWLVTLTFREVQDQGQLSNAPVLLLAPWVRLQASSDVPDDGHQLVLATVTLDASGLVTALEIHSGGPGAGFSFSDRNAASFVDVPGAGERWVWYAQDGTARLWSGADVFSVGKTCLAGAARLQLPSPGNSLEVSAVGARSAL